MQQRLVLSLLLLAMAVFATAAAIGYWKRRELRHRIRGVCFSEDFEGPLDPMISVVSQGSFLAPPGVNISEGKGDGTFSFGKSQCSASCFSQYETTLRIVFPEPLFIREVSFREKETGSNWGSDGIVLLDGLPWKPGAQIPGSGSLVFGHFGRAPHNDHLSDREFRDTHFEVNREVEVVELRVTDITNESAVVIDDIVID